MQSRSGRHGALMSIKIAVPGQVPGEKSQDERSLISQFFTIGIGEGVTRTLPERFA